jgi:uncharacterized protein YjiS (DUF1127 family)
MMKGQKGYVLVRNSVFGGVFGKGLLATVLRWFEVRRQRQLLASLSDDALKDIGMSRADIQQETERPFWNDPLRR